MKKFIDNGNKRYAAS